MPAFKFVGPSYEARSSNFDAQVCINLYTEMSESGASKSVAALIGTPGLLLYKTLTGGSIRGEYRFTTDISIVVAGTNVWRVNRSGADQLIGVIDNDATPARMADNGTTVMLVTGANGYFIEPFAATLTQIFDGAFVGADFVGFVAGRFVWNKKDTGQFQYTEPYSIALDALNFYTAESSPDNITALAVNHSEVWLFGPNSVETWVLTQDNSDPFGRIQGAQMETGIDAAGALAKMDNTLFWLGGDDRGRGIVLKAVGYSKAQRVSNHAIEFAIASYGDVSDATSWTYQQEGHTFYVLSFPSANKTWCLDAATGMWHQRAWRSSDGSLHRVRGATQMEFDGDTIVGDWENGNLYRLGLDTYTDNGAAIARVRAAPHLADDLKQQLFHSMQIDMETGVGLSSGQGSDPQAMLQWSDDGGHTWSNEYWVSIGRMGEYRRRARWRRLGRSRDRVFRVTITDPIKVAIIGASVDVTPCLS